jgi:UDP-N-acetylmuramate--alanine ligase
LDIYGNANALTASFEAFAKRIKPKGRLFVKKGLPLEGITYGIETDADYNITHIRIENGVYIFDIETPQTLIKNVVFTLPGRHNLSNALIAFAMAETYGCSHEALVKALKTYKGVKRRFTYQIKTKELVYIDDYAHHPEEINAVHSAVREMYPNKEVLAVFQPHLYSRTRDFIEEFAKSLAQFDAVLLLDIYPARELPIPGVTSSWLLNKIDVSYKKLVSKAALASEIQQSGASIILTIGAGDIGEEVKHIKKALQVAH